MSTLSHNRHISDDFERKVAALSLDTRIKFSGMILHLLTDRTDLADLDPRTAKFTKRIRARRQRRQQSNTKSLQKAYTVETETVTLVTILTRPGFIQYYIRDKTAGRSPFVWRHVSDIRR